MSKPTEPKSPSIQWLKDYVTPTLVDAPPYKIDAPKVTVKLDQNESPWDLPESIKKKVTARLLDRAWNRYPSPFSDDLAEKVARYAGVSPDSVLLGPGSNYLISLALSVFSKGFQRPGAKGKMVIARPSFPLYESHCQYEGIPYETWNLNSDLEYDLKLLPELTPGSMLVFASPNNPVGNTLRKKTLQELLEKHPETLVLADEAYVEYASEPYTDLVGRYPNLMLLRTFSKTMGCAGVRIGYFIAHPTYLNLMKKLRLPYLLNHFSLACADVLLDDPEMRAHLAMIQQNAVTQRGQVYEKLRAVADRGGFQVKPSEANFLLLRWPDNAAMQRYYQGLIEHGILVRNVSGAPGLTGCLRITLGNENENLALVKAFEELVKS